MIITTILTLLFNLAVVAYESSNISFVDNKLRILSDGFFVSGIFVLCFALITFVSQEGGLYFMGYLGHRLRYSIRKEGELIHYYQYVEKKKEVGKLNLSPLFIVSIVSILISLILAII